MEDLGRNYISDEELYSLLTDDEERELLAHCAVWNKREAPQGIVQWQFEHNNFQEYLAARILARQDFHTIKAFLSFPAVENKIIPSWLNTLAFLINIIDKNDYRFTELFDWLFQHNPDMIVHFELDRIDEKTRNKVIIDIYNYYKDKKIWINRDKFDLDALAQFGESLSVVEFLINEINSDLHYTTSVNALRLISFMKIPISKSDGILHVLKKIVLEESRIALVRNTALNAMIQLEFYNDELVNEIINSLKNSTDDLLRTSLYRYLRKSNTIDEHIEVILEGIHYVGIHIEESPSMDEKYELERALKELSSPMALKKVLRFIGENLFDIDTYFLKDNISVISNKAVNIYYVDSTIFKFCLDFYISLNNVYSPAETSTFVSFFNKTGTKLRAIEEIYNVQAEEKNWWAIGLLTNSEDINFLFDLVKIEGLSNSDILLIHNVLDINTRGVFVKHINEIMPGRIEFKPIRNFDEERKEELNQDIEMIFNKSEFVESIRTIYLREQKDSMTGKQIIKASIEARNSEYKFPNIVVRTLNQLAGNGSLSLEDAISRMEAINWDVFCIDKVHDLLKAKEVEISFEKKEWIENWCLKNIEHADFKHALTKNADGITSTNGTCCHLWFFFRELNLAYPKSTLLDMISYDWISGSQLLGIEYLEEHLDLKEMTARIWHNIQEGIGNDEILLNHLKFCERHGIKDILPTALNLICDTTKSDYYRSSVLELYIAMSNDLRDLVSKLGVMKDRFRYEVIKKLFDRGYQNECQDYLKTFFLEEDQEEGKLEACRYLIISQNVDGLKEFLNIVKSQMKLNKKIAVQMPLESLKIVEAVPYLIELLNLSYQDVFKYDEFHSVDSVIRNALLKIALQSHDAYLYVREEVEKFIVENNQYEHINFLNAFLEDMESQFYVTLQSGRRISDVIERMRELKMYVN